MPLVFVIRVLKPFYFIKFSSILSSRIGHFVSDSVHLMILSRNSREEPHRLIFFEEPSSNEFWAKLVKRNLNINQWSRYLFYWNTKIPGGQIFNEHSIFLSNHSRDFDGLFENSGFKLSFSEEENIKGKDWLKSKGWVEGDPFVCLLVRDESYLQSSSILSPDGKGWDYHSYRDSDIEDYLPALDWLTTKGVFVLRMGKLMKQPIDTDNKRILDYAFSKERNDFLDVWLFANCNLCISTGSGPDYISDVFRRPLLFLNFIPISHAISWSNAMHVPKKLIWADSGQELSLRENINNSWFNTDHYSDHKIKIQDMSKDEILVSVRECWEDLENGLHYSKRDLKLQKRFWEIIRSEPKSKKLHGWIHPKTRAGTNWLGNRREDFFV